MIILTQGGGWVAICCNMSPVNGRYCGREIVHRDNVRARARARSSLLLLCDIRLSVPVRSLEISRATTVDVQCFFEAAKREKIFVPGRVSRHCFRASQPVAFPLPRPRNQGKGNKHLLPVIRRPFSSGDSSSSTYSFFFFFLKEVPCLIAH